MPPRHKPKTSTPAKVEQDDFRHPSAHAAGFQHYLRAECGMAANTVAAYTADLEKFLEWYSANQNGPVSSVTLAKLSDYLKFLHGQNYASTTIARHLVSLKMFFRFLVLEGMLQESVAELLNSPKLWQYLPKVLSPEKVNVLLSSPCGEDAYPLRDRALLCMLYATGCRASELANMRVDQLHLGEGFCKCLGKGNKERIVSLNPVAIAALEAYLDNERSQLAGHRDDDSLFLSRTGRSLTRIMIWNIVKKYAARIGASQDVSPHTLRHSFATHMLAGGAEIRALQELMGHASIRTTQIYTHVEHSRLKSIHRQHHPRG